MAEKTGSFIEWLVPFAFVVTASWLVWHIPAFILDLIPPASESLVSQISELHARKDVTPNLAGPFGGRADWVDWIALIALPILFYLGTRTVRVATMEYDKWRPIDRIALFIGRITMVLIISMTMVMLYEVFLRYVVERPTLWANELTLWVAGFVFLLSGVYAMQQRCHIRIFIIYDLLPRPLRKTCDVIWVSLFVVFAAFLVYGSYSQVFVTKLYRWEMFGTAFDPPIPATVQPMILIVACLVAAQAVVNLIADWNVESDHAATEVDEDEIAAIKRSLETR